MEFSEMLNIALMQGFAGLSLFSVLLLMGLFATSEEELTKADGVNLNLWTGLALLVTSALFLLWGNATNLGLIAGIMIGHGRSDVFFGLITPHGLLELTELFVSTAAGLRMAWAWIDPGPRTRMQALASAGRSTIGMVMGLAVVLLITGIIEAFVTPSPLPTWLRVGIGIAAEIGFLVYVWTLGRRAHRAGEDGDVELADRDTTDPVAA